MSEIASLVVGSERLTSIFGRWPSFHDAEIHDLHLQRGCINPEDQVYEFPLFDGKTSPLADDARY
jgi:hypothetical protein